MAREGRRGPGLLLIIAGTTLSIRVNPGLLLSAPKTSSDLFAY